MRRAVLLLAVTPALALVPLVAGGAARAETAPPPTDQTLTQLYWSSGTDISEATIYTRSAAGTEAKLLDGFHPQINPAGTTLVYTSSHGTGAGSTPATQAVLSTLDLTDPAATPLQIVPGGVGETTADIHGYDVTDQSVPRVPASNSEGGGAGKITVSTPPAGTVVYDHYDGETCEEDVVDADGDQPSSSEFSDFTNSCDVEPAWGTDDRGASSNPTIYAPNADSASADALDVSTSDGFGQSPGSTNRPYPGTSAPTGTLLAPSYGVVPRPAQTCQATSCTPDTGGRAIYTQLATNGSRIVRVLPTQDLSDDPQSFPTIFSPSSPVDAWHWSSDGLSVVSAQTLDGVHGIWRLDPTHVTQEAELIDGVTAADADWVTRPTPGTIIVASSFPTTIGNDGRVREFTTTVDNTGASPISGGSLDIDIAVPAGVTADMVTLTFGQTAVPLTLAAGHLTGSLPIGTVDAASTSDLPMSIQVSGRAPGGPWTTSFGVSGSTATADAQRGRAASPASGALAQAFIPTQVAGGIPTATSVSATPGTGTTATPITVSAHVASGQAQPTVRAHAAGDPSGGQVQFTEDGSPLGSPVTIDGSGNAALPAQTFAVGPHSFTASYSGDDGNPGHLASTSATPASVTITAPPSPDPSPSPSPSPSAAPLKAPNAPVITGIAPKPGKLLPAWTAPTTGAPVTGYTITCSRVRGLQVVTATTTALTTTLSGLLNNADYLCEVVAHSAAGDSPQSALVRARPGTLPKVTLTGKTKVKKNATLTLKGTAFAAGQPMTDRVITLSFRPAADTDRTDVAMAMTDSKGGFSFKVKVTEAGAYQATLVLGPSISRDKEHFVRVR